MNIEKNYDDLKPISGESIYVEFDEDTNCWGHFGDESGFCYNLYSSESEAKDNL